MSETQPGAAIEARGVDKRFGAREVLRAIDLQIRAGEFVAIVGRSGCGKSTLLRLLAGLEATSGGEVRVGGEPPRAGRDSVRMMFQDARLLPWKRALDNVALGLPGERRAEAERALHEVGLGGRERDWPAVLSGGQRQRVALARALVTQPKLLLLDEPLGALDALTRIEMQGLIERVWREHGFTAVLVTHDVAEAVAMADRVLVIAEGEIDGDVRVGLDRPRHRSDPRFGTIEEAVLGRVLGHRGLDGRAEVRTLGDRAALVRSA